MKLNQEFMDRVIRPNTPELVQSVKAALGPGLDSDMAEAIVHAAMLEFISAYEDAAWNLNLDDAPRDGTRVDLWVKDEDGEKRLPDYCYNRYFGVPGFWYESNGGPNKIHENYILAWRPVPDGPQS